MKIMAFEVNELSIMNLKFLDFFIFLDNSVMIMKDFLKVGIWWNIELMPDD